MLISELFAKLRISHYLSEVKDFGVRSQDYACEHSPWGDLSAYQMSTHGRYISGGFIHMPQCLTISFAL